MWDADFGCSEEGRPGTNASCSPLKSAEPRAHGREAGEEQGRRNAEPEKKIDQAKADQGHKRDNDANTAEV